jgi:hypothetical protein
MSHDNQILKGKVFYDKNATGIQDSAEFNYSAIKLFIYPSRILIIPDEDGNFSFKGKSGEAYEIKIQDSSIFSSIRIDQKNLLQA